MEYDKDLRSIQEARDLIKNAKIAQKQFASWSQADIDKLTKHICEACVRNAEPLAKMAQQETGFGKWEDKVLKNLLGSKMTYEAMANLKTVGIINENRAQRYFEVAVPVGVVVALIPSTNPTSTVMYKCLISLKAGNSIVISPHPGAQNCILETVKIIQQACKECGAPDNIVQVVKTPTIQATETLMKHKDTGLILATGGEAMVHAAYSSGNPALGVGPGNGPAFIEKSADIHEAVRRIVESKTFDNGTICASEQSVITQECIKREVMEEMKRQHCYFMTPEETDKVGRFIMRANNTMNPAIVGKTAKYIADMAGISIPSDTLILVAETSEVGKKNPYSREKLCPILAFFTVKNWEEACDKSIEILENEDAYYRFKAVCRQYLITEVDQDTTLESHLYHLTPDQPAAGVYTELGARVKLSVPVVKKGIFGREHKVYKEEIWKITELMELSVQKKQFRGIVLTELQIPKIRLREFAV